MVHPSPRYDDPIMHKSTSLMRLDSDWGGHSLCIIPVILSAHIPYNHALPEISLGDDASDNFESIPTLLQKLNLLGSKMDHVESTFDVSTFTKLVGLRALTGVTRIVEHQLLNGLSTNHISSSYVLVDPPKDLLERIVTNRPITTYCKLVVEARTGDDYNNALFYYIKDDVVVKLVMLIVYSDKLVMEVYESMDHASLIDHSWIMEVVKPYLSPNITKVQYVCGYNDRGDMIIDTRDVVETEALTSDLYYPYLVGGIDKLVADFMASNNDLLFLIGPPGTGKSSLIRNMLTKMPDRTIYQWSGDTTILHGAFTPSLATLPPKSTVVLEDADNLMMPRTEGNAQMSMLLNEINGITGKKHKYIFSTNLENLKMVDPAIIRKGRCFNVLEMKLLSRQDVQNIVNDNPAINMDRMAGNDYITLGDLLSDGNELKSKRFGF